jgi:hypothetical protein
MVALECQTALAGGKTSSGLRLSGRRPALWVRPVTLTNGNVGEARSFLAPFGGRGEEDVLDRHAKSSTGLRLSGSGCIDPVKDYGFLGSLRDLEGGRVGAGQNSRMSGRSGLRLSGDWWSGYREDYVFLDPGAEFRQLRMVDPNRAR